jgi:hypothetical protein
MTKDLEGDDRGLLQRTNHSAFACRVSGDLKTLAKNMFPCRDLKQVPQRVAVVILLCAPLETDVSEIRSSLLL